MRVDPHVAATERHRAERAFDERDEHPLADLAPRDVVAKAMVALRKWFDA